MSLDAGKCNQGQTVILNIETISSNLQNNHKLGAQRVAKQGLQ